MLRFRQTAKTSENKKTIMKKTVFILFIIALFVLSFAEISGSRNLSLVSKQETIVENPEDNQAFYGELKGSPNTFKIVTKTPIDLNAGILVPDLSGVEKNTSMEVYTEKNLPDGRMTADGKTYMETAFAILDGSNADWAKYYDAFTGDNYFKGEEFVSTAAGALITGSQLEPGTYFIRIYNRSNKGKYVLYIGTKEKFSIGKVFNNAVVLPKINLEFFGKSVLVAFWNWAGLLLFSLVMFVLLILFLKGPGKAHKSEITDLNGSEEEKV